MASDKGKTQNKPAVTARKSASQAAARKVASQATARKSASQAAARKVASQAAARQTAVKAKFETSKNKNVKSEYKKSPKTSRTIVQNRRQLGNTGIQYGIVKTPDGGTRTWWDTGKRATSGHSTTVRRGNRVFLYAHQPNKAPAKGWSYNLKTKNTARIRGK